MEKKIEKNAEYDQYVGQMAAFHERTVLNLSYMLEQTTPLSKQRILFYMNICDFLSSYVEMINDIVRPHVCELGFDDENEFIAVQKEFMADMDNRVLERGETVKNVFKLNIIS